MLLTLFEKADDCEAFERVLADAIAREHLPIFAWTVRLNHLHFVLRPETDSQLSDFFRWVTHTHTMRWHAHSHTEGTGHLYQGRFKTFPIEPDDHLLTVLRYVERNPLRTSLCERAEDWRCGSLWRRKHGTPEQQQTLSEWPIARPRQWVAHVNRAQSESELTSLRSSVRKGTPFGGHRLVIQSAARLQLEHASLSVETDATDKDVRRTNRETISGQFLIRPDEEDTRCTQFFELGTPWRL